MSDSKVSTDGNKVYIERGDTFFEITVTDEGIIVDMYGDKGYEFINSPFAATWDEMLPDDENEEDKELHANCVIEKE